MGKKQFKVSSKLGSGVVWAHSAQSAMSSAFAATLMGGGPIFEAVSVEEVKPAKSSGIWDGFTYFG